jgi:peroxiredoxin
MSRRIVLPLVLLLALSACGEGGRQVVGGDAAPPFALTTLAGETLRFPSDFVGRAVAIRFWAAWCPYCEKEMKEIDPVAARLAAEGLSVLAVNVGQDRSSVQSFVDRVGFRYPALLDEPAATARLYGVQGLPTTFFVLPNGKVRSRLVGEADAATFERLARELIAAGGGSR